MPRSAANTTRSEATGKTLNASSRRAASLPFATSGLGRAERSVRRRAVLERRRRPERLLGLLRLVLFRRRQARCAGRATFAVRRTWRRSRNRDRSDARGGVRRRPANRSRCRSRTIVRAATARASNNAICPQCHGTGRVIANEAVRRHDSQGRPRRSAHSLSRSRQPWRGRWSEWRPLSGGHLKTDPKFRTQGRRSLRRRDGRYLRPRPRREVRVPTMTGDVTVTIRPARRTTSCFGSPAKGCRKSSGSGNGDEYVRLIGKLPTQLSERERELFEELAALRTAKA
jgi:hypothetical protein